MSEKVTVLFQRLDPRATIPTKATDASAGYDLVALEGGTLPYGAYKLIRTGIAMALPEGYEAQVRGRSGLALKRGIVQKHGVGTIDADYRGEVGILLSNEDHLLKRDFEYKGGDRLAQLVIQSLPSTRFEEVASLPPSAQRGEGGFGSTGGYKA